MLTKFDPARHIETIADALEYLNAAAEGDDIAHFLSAMDDVRRALLRTDSLNGI